MANSTATLNGVTYISKADYDILYGNGTTHGTIDKTVDGVSKTISYDANKVYIIKEEEVNLPFSKITNGIATSGDVILSTPATASSIWNSILEAKGSTYTFCTQANVLKLINSKAASETNHVTFSGSNGITISTSGTANDATVTFVAPDTNYTLSTLSAGVNQDQEDSFTSSFAYLRLNLSNPASNIKWTVDNVTNATYATRIGDSTSNYTYSQLVNISSTATTANASAQSAYRAAITNVLSTITDANSTCGYLATTSAIYNFVTGKISTVYFYKGTQSYGNLSNTTNSGTIWSFNNGITQETLTNGDVYNTSDDFTLNGISYKAGTNLAWDNTKHIWDALGGAYALTFAGTGTATITPSYGGVTLPSFTINNVAHSTNAQRLDLITTTSSIDEALGCERITITAGNSGPTTTFSLMYANEAKYADNIGTGGTQGTNYLTAAQVIQALTITYLV